MNIEKYFESLSREIDSLKNRVRYLIDMPQWLTDGEWKESVIRQILRRNLPRTVEVGRGFVVTAAASSSQIDVLVYDASKPVLFRDGDLAFVTPDAVYGLVEVKTSLDPASFEKTLKKLCKNIELIRLHPNSNALAAVFAFESASGNGPQYLEALCRISTTWNRRLDFAAIGDSIFLRYWNEDPENLSKPHECWHSYYLPKRAPGYFVHNVIDHVSPQTVFSNKEVWYPVNGKEPDRDGCKKSPWA